MELIVSKRLEFPQHLKAGEEISLLLDHFGVVTTVAPTTCVIGQVDLYRLSNESGIRNGYMAVFGEKQ